MNNRDEVMCLLLKGWNSGVFSLFYAKNKKALLVLAYHKFMQQNHIRVDLIEFIAFTITSWIGI